MIIICERNNFKSQRLLRVRKNKGLNSHNQMVFFKTMDTKKGNRLNQTVSLLFK